MATQNTQFYCYKMKQKIPQRGNNSQMQSAETETYTWLLSLSWLGTDTSIIKNLKNLKNSSGV